MLKSDVNVLDIFDNSSLTYINESINKDKSVNGNPVSEEVKENSKNKAVIGKIGGIGANSNEPTRNGRRYPIELWQKVEKDEYFIEGMENRTIIGEADHPVERVDYSVKEGAVVLTKYEIRNDGTVYTEFDILDTLPGRTIKTYYEAGCKLGVSSRGLGEEVVRNSETIIDPDTYQFYCFDVVAFPAVKSARMELLESTSPKKKSLINSINSEINKCKTLDEVLYIESTAKGLDLYLDEIKECVENKKISLNESKENNDDMRSLLDQLKSEINSEKLSKDAPMFLKTALDLIDEIMSKINPSDKEIEIANKLSKEIDEYISEQDLTNVKENNKIQLSKSNIDSNEDTLGKINDEDVDIDKKDDRKILLSNDDLTNKVKSLEKDLQLKNSIIQKLLIKTNSSDLIINEKLEVIKSLIEKNHTVKLEKSKLQKNLNNEILKNESLNSKYAKLQKVNEDFSKIIDAYNLKYVKLDKSYKNLSESYKALENDKSSLSKNNIKLQESINNSNNDLANKNNKLLESNNIISCLKSELNSVNESLKDKSLKYDSVVSDNKKLINANKVLNESYVKCLDSYIDARCAQYNLDKNTLYRLLGENYDIVKVDEIVNKMVKNNYKLSLLPFNNVTPDKQIYVENAALVNSNTVNSSNEDLDMFEIMLSSKNN